MKLADFADLGVLGPLTIDLMRKDNQERTFVSGTILFSLWTAVSMGVGAKGYSIADVTAIDAVRTSYGSLYPLIEWRRSETTHRFLNEFDSRGIRTQSILELAPPIVIPPKWGQAKCWHLGPLCNGDIHPSVFGSAVAEGVFISVDLQGFTRARRIGPVKSEVQSDVYEVLKSCSVAKMDVTEAELVFGSRSIFDIARALSELSSLEALVTDNLNGAWFVSRDRIIWMPAKNISISTDPSGCGDVFSASFVVARSRGFTIEQALSLATSLAAENAAHYGVPAIKSSSLGPIQEC